MNPSLVKVHIQHPPEASVQIHQVARVRGEVDPVLSENSVETRASHRSPASPSHSHWASNSIPAQAGEAPRPPPPVLSRHQGLLGRCYLSTVNGQVRTKLPSQLFRCPGRLWLPSLWFSLSSSFHFPLGEGTAQKYLSGWGCSSVSRVLVSYAEGPQFDP